MAGLVLNPYRFVAGGGQVVGSDFDSTGQTTVAQGTDVTVSNWTPTAGSDRIALVSVSWELGTGPDADDVTIGGTSITKIASAAVSTQYGAVYRMLESAFPSFPADVVVTTPGSDGDKNVRVGVWSVANVNQTTPVNQTATGTATAVNTYSESITPTVGDSLVFDVANIGSAGATHTPTSSQTVLDYQGSDSIATLHQYFEDRPTSPATTFTGDWSAFQSREVHVLFALSPV